MKYRAPRSLGDRASTPSLSVVPEPAEKPVLTAEEAFAVLGIDRSTGYKAIREGTFPVPVLRIGRLIRVPTAPLAALLQLDSSGRAS